MTKFPVKTKFGYAMAVLNTLGFEKTETERKQSDTLKSFFFQIRSGVCNNFDTGLGLEKLETERKQRDTLKSFFPNSFGSLQLLWFWIRLEKKSDVSNKF